jgi:indole-3-glycerol phosphate synthase
MTILKKIIEHKHAEIEIKKKKVSLDELSARIKPAERIRSLRRILSEGNSSGIIAEIKKQSPSKGAINLSIDVAEVAAGYETAGAAAISVLTDEKYFGGSDNDLRLARSAAMLPILRKDFIVDEYQILESKLLGADLILLIARVLSPTRTEELSKFAKQHDLEVLLEVHNEKELHDNINDDVDIIGVNNRDLDTLKIDLLLSFKLSDQIPEGFVQISESGLSSVETVLKLRDAGYDGFLMGENFMQAEKPHLACAEFIAALK